MRQTELVPLTQLVADRVALKSPQRVRRVELGHMCPGTMRILLRKHTNARAEGFNVETNELWNAVAEVRWSSFEQFEQFERISQQHNVATQIVMVVLLAECWDSKDNGLAIAGRQFCFGPLSL